MSDIQISDAVTDAERLFAVKDLLECEYFAKYRRGYYNARELGLLNPCRNYITLLTALTEVHEYDEQHARSFAKRFRDGAKDFRNCDAVFAELIVYRHYIGAVRENLVRKIELRESEADVIVERADGSKMFLEVFSVNPDFPLGTPEKPIVNDVRTHTQDAMASIRQKLLRKIRKQRQMSTPRENYAVIELNNPTIAGDFSILSSLSAGYKVRFSTRTLRPISGGYDWSESVFDDPATRFLKGIIYFSLGDYSSRRLLPNPNVRRFHRAPLGEAFSLDSFLNTPNPKLFDPDRIVTASEPFDVDEFIHKIHEGRDGERKELSD